MSDAMVEMTEADARELEFYRHSDAVQSERATSQIAWNQRLRWTLEPCMQVPAVTENWWEHLVHCQVRFLPATGEHVVPPHSGQTQPCGHLSSMIRLSQLLSSGYLLCRACRLPIAPFSALTCLRFTFDMGAPPVLDACRRGQCYTGGRREIPRLRHLGL